MYIYIINSVKDFPKTRYKNSLIVTNSYEVSSYAIKNKIKFKEFSEIISFEQCSKTNVHDNFNNWFNQSNDYQEYFYSLKYSLGNQIKSIELAKSFSTSLCLNYNFETVFLSYSLSPSFKRENINNFQNKLISYFLVLNKKKVVNIKKPFKLIESIHSVLYKSLPYITKAHFVSEQIFNYFKYLSQKSTKSQRNNCEILSFSAGTDTMYISKLIDKINSNSTLNIQSKSTHDFKYSNFKNTVYTESFYLQNILKIKQFVKINRSDIINILSNNDLNIKSFFLTNTYYIDYILFRVLREGFQINLFKNIIKKLRPKVVISGSLYLPLIAANSLNIKTVSIADGLGISENPVSPHHGINILSPNQFYLDQIKNQYDYKSYYIIGHEIFQ